MCTSQMTGHRVRPVGCKVAARGGGRGLLAVFAAVGLAVVFQTGCSQRHAEPELQGRPGVLASTRAAPMPPREFRAVWIATVGNIDWPSRPGLSTEQQQSELRRLLDLAAELRLNAVILQVRPIGDAFYVSRTEPWSQYLTGEMGRPPDPVYDPLAFAIREAHDRGLELHAWFNPFRVGLGGRQPAAARHVTLQRPQWVRRYGDKLWLDPGEAAARAYVLQVIRDVVRRYDLDGVHLDDYFYPYPERDASNQRIAFPDDETFTRYRARGGTLARDDWRRENINTFVADLYRMVRTEKPHVKVGISPFGIWRSGHPPQIRGLDAYAEIYADARRWLAEGWLDYFTPQLYWRIAQPAQSYPVLLSWWADQNTRSRHLWAGNFTSRVSDREQNWPAEEIVQQIALTRTELRAGGNVHFSARALLRNAGGIADALRTGPYRDPALVPASPWLAAGAPAPPAAALFAVPESENVRVTLNAEGGTDPRWWLVRARYGGAWYLRLAPGARRALLLPGRQAEGVLEIVTVAAVDGAGQVSVPVVME